MVDFLGKGVGLLPGLVLVFSGYFVVLGWRGLGLDCWGLEFY